MGEDQSQKSEFYAKLESLAKFLAGVAAVIGSIWVPIVLSNYSEQSRRTQLYMQIMTEREKSDTTIRENMFETLLTKYLGAFTDDELDSEKSFRKRIMFLDLLSLNFQEYLNAKPLFEDLSGRLGRAIRDATHPADKVTFLALQTEVKKVAARIASKQAATLSSIGLTRELSLDTQDMSLRCVRLYDVSGRKEMQDGKTVSLIDITDQMPCNETKPAEAGLTDVAPQGQGSPSIDIELLELGDTSATVEVTPYEEFFNQEGILTSMKQGKRMVFEVSFFDLPYMDNTELFDGSRFSLVLKGIAPDVGAAKLSAVIFKEGFMTLRDRPLFEEMLQTLQNEAGVN